MKVFLQTRFTKLSELYDTNAPASKDSGSGIGKMVTGILRPYAVVKEGNYKLYEYGNPYVDESMKYKLALGAVAVGVASAIFGLGRLSK